MRNDRVNRGARQAYLLGPLALLAACYSGLGKDGGAGGADGASEGGGSDGGGSDAGDSTGDGPQAACESPSVGITALRRLTAVQYNNSVRDLLGYSGDAAEGFAPDERVGPFQSNVGAPISEVQVEQYMDAAETIAAWSVGDMGTLLPCDPAAVGEDACATAFIAEFGPRAYRRPLDAGELMALQQVYNDGKAQADFANGIRLVVQAALQSPWFLYHMEFGAQGTNDGELVELTGHELAARLSYFVWNSIPDDTLFDAATDGDLATPEGLTAQVDRMLADPRARDTIAGFHLQWLGVDQMSGLEKNADTFPTFTPELAAAMQAETAAFASHVVLEGDGLFDTLFTADFTLTEDPDLLALYGVTLPPDHVPGDPVPLPAAQRMGILTQASILARHAHVNQTSPVHRGKLVRENLLCQPLPPPPPDVNAVPPTPDPNATTRERFEQHRTDPSCSGCHQLIDPIGFTFEHYDGIGTWRDVEAGAAIDASGEFVMTDIDGPLDGAIDMSSKLTQSDDVKRCVTRQWFRFATGRNEAEEDACTNDALDTSFVESGGDIRLLIRDLVASDAFRYRRSEASALVESPEGDR